MRRQGILEHVLRPATPFVRARNHSRRAVLGREVVEHPDGVADPVALFVGDRRHVDVQRLRHLAVRIGGTRIQAAQLHLRPEHVPDALDHLRQHDRAAEDLALVHKVGQPVRVRFGPELAPGAIAFHVEDVVDPFPQLAEQIAAHAVLEHDESLLVELMPFSVRHG